MQTQRLKRGSLITLAGTLLPPSVFAALQRLNQWEWHPIDWLEAAPAQPLSVVATTLTEDIDALDLPGKRILIGHSAGGVLAQAVATQLAQPLDGLILLCTGAEASHHGDPDAPQRLLQNGLDSFLTPFFNRCFGAAFCALPEAQPLLHYCRLYALGFDAKDIAPAMTSLRLWDLRSQLSAISCPTLILYGEDDPARGMADANVMAAGIPNAHIVALPSGHTPMVTHQEQFLESLLPFLNQVFRTSKTAAA
ncbi:alpha/beta fold hydrolase [Pokkaliibacter sp. CJK22405]|uniref:alpha/beta fold hydrolase n=1 Tax=Pokkaliibacter sp. CJK22405 TaxID=3384615 RepID=UPI003984B69E